MNILLVIHEQLDPNSGAAGSTFRIGEEYRKLGHNVHYYSMDRLPKKLPSLVQRFLFPEFVATQILQLSRKEHFDVIDASTGDAWFWAKLLRHFHNHPTLLVTRSHGLEHLKNLADREDARLGNLTLSWKYRFYRGSIQLWEVATSMQCADLVFLLNQQERSYAIECLNVKPERAHVFPNGIPDSFLKLPYEPLSDSKTSPLKIAQVSTYIPRKGIHYSAPALNRILRRYPNVQVSFFGTACFECQDVAQVYADFAPEVRDRIQVIPRFQHDQLPTLLRGYHIKLFPPLSEGFGKALVEAMACGLAPITTSTPGPMEIARDGHDAIVVPPRDSQAIENALERLINDRVYLEQLRCNAYSTAQHFSWQSIAQARLCAYEATIHQKNTALHKSYSFFK
ncbi:glycosyltransferase family 4 protein [Oscillatoria sp. FACHB-1407]|uniref:glycosyltransferase family 4 protein n=1 Tax=Oscillatoria sp. FACHB-1407 TaxID=2692847 RepID=UPI001685380D|nr:glycosyltransferase family 4 protein [Oscillatoria sp. FACHB-1407]MBD2459704.1 glycosyltransferase family 4 protein [Oscillatoria sp. FACHB-1407]